MTRLIEQCQEAGVKQVFLVTPPIYDFAPKKGEFNYHDVLAQYAKWELTIKTPGVTVIELHHAMRMAATPEPIRSPPTESTPATTGTS